MQHDGPRKFLRSQNLCGCHDMKILFVHNRFGATARGGAERVVELLASAFADRNHEIHVVRPKQSRNSQSHGRIFLHDFWVPNIRSFDQLGSLATPFRMLWHGIDAGNIPSARSFARLLRAIDPDIVHTHNLVGFGGLFPGVLRRARVPWIHTLHDVQLLTPSGLLIHDAPAHPIERSVLGRVFRSFRRSRFGSPTVVTSPTRWLLDLHRRSGFFPQSRTAIIGNPVELAPLTTRSGAVRSILFIGQLEGAKGVHILIEAFRRIRAVAPDALLHVIGDGSAAPALRRASRDIRGIVLRGRLSSEAITEALRNADLLVVPSLCAENQPSVILEAFAAGVPVIASRVGGIPEIVRDGETGFLVDPGSVDDLFRVLWCCIEEPSRVRDMAVNCHEAVTVHGVDRIVDQWEAMYTAAASGTSIPYVGPTIGNAVE